LSHARPRCGPRCRPKNHVGRTTRSTDEVMHDEERQSSLSLCNHRCTRMSLSAVSLTETNKCKCTNNQSTDHCGSATDSLASAGCSWAWLCSLQVNQTIPVLCINVACLVQSEAEHSAPQRWPHRNLIKGKHLDLKLSARMRYSKQAHI